MTEEDRAKNPEDAELRGLNPTEYRYRLLSKLNCLISVLEVAIGKISSSLEKGASNNKERLGRIRINLENTLAICRRAKGTLSARLMEKQKPGPKSLANRDSKTAEGSALSFRSYVELSSIEEFRKFKNMKSISAEEIDELDIDELSRKLSEDS